MILIDLNVFIYAYSARAPQHPAARAWLEQALAGHEPVLLPWAVVHGFLRLITSSRLLDRPFTIADATMVVDEWLATPAVVIVEPGVRYWSILRTLLVQTRAHGNLVSDAHLAALAIEHDATLYTADRDFARFPNLRVINPLASSL